MCVNQGSVVKQDAIGMLPALLLNVESHHKVTSVFHHCVIIHCNQDTMNCNCIAYVIHCGSKKPDPCYIFRCLQQVLINIYNFWYR